MKCENCRERESVIHVQQILGSETVEMHLCEKCAEERGISKRNDKIELSLSQLLTGLLDAPGKGAGDKPVECHSCSTQLEDFKQDGKLGCPECYTAFADEIRSIHKKLSGLVQHKGKVPAKLVTYKALLIDREKLKSRLSAAVQREDYETAASIRDQIRTLESSGDAQDDSFQG